MAKNIEGLITHAQARSADTQARAETAIKQLKADGEKVTFAAIARISGLSRSTLYSNEFVKVRIQSLSALEKTPTSPKQKPKKELSVRLAALTEQIMELKKQKLLLIAQLTEMELLRMENEELKRIVRSRAKRA